MNEAPSPATIDDYIAGFPPDVRLILERVRNTIRNAAPEATERLSYSMPTFVQGRVLVHFGGFKDHIGLYPPVRGPELQDRVARYRGEKGNLKFPLSEPIPYDLIREIVKTRLEARSTSPASTPGSGRTGR